MHTFEEVGLEVDIEDVSAQTLDGVVEGKNVDALAVLDVEARVYVNEITKLDAQVITSDLVQLDAALLDVVGAQANENGVLALLATAKGVNG
jgi:hypothetical protein